MASKHGGSVQGQNQKDTVAGATIVTKNARLIIQQEPISAIKEIPNLPTHQKAAQTQAKQWIDKIWPLIIKTTNELIDYAGTYQSAYTQLLTLVPRLEKGDKEAKDEFVQVLQLALIPALEDKATVANGIAGDIRKFHDNFEPLYQEFLKDFNAANKVMVADNQEILDDQADLTKWKVKATAYEKSAIAMGVALPITCAATDFFSETGVGLIIGGILMASELAVMATMLRLYADALKHVNELTSEIKSLHNQVAQLTLIEKQITGLQEHTLAVVTTSANVADGWIALKQALGDTVGHLQTITPEQAAIIIKIQLSVANKEWGVALEQAKALQPNGGRLDKKYFNTSDGMQKAIEKQAKKAQG